MLYKFTYNDPDKNGANDTYGMAVSKFKGPFQVTGTWFNAGNNWVKADDGSLQPTFMTKGYMENLDFWKKMYDNKVINQDFAVFDTTKWPNELYNGKAGVLVDVLDNADRVQDNLTKADPTKTENVWSVNTIEGPYGKKNLPTSGYNSIFVFPKQATKDEARLGVLLTFMDKMLDKEPNNIISNGIEGTHYTVENGNMKAITPPAYTISGLNQISTLVSTGDNTPLKNFATPVRKHTAELTNSKESISYCVADPTLPLTSASYATKGTQLDDIIETARVKYIMGQIDAKGFNDAVELWKKQGGNDVMKEYTDAFKALKK
jgi:putative aldouronate transport system substrate-binding protein